MFQLATTKDIMPRQYCIFDPTIAGTALKSAPWTAITTLFPTAKSTPRQMLYFRKKKVIYKVINQIMYSTGGKVKCIQPFSALVLCHTDPITLIHTGEPLIAAAVSHWADWWCLFSKVTLRIMHSLYFPRASQHAWDSNQWSFRHDFSNRSVIATNSNVFAAWTDNNW